MLAPCHLLMWKDDSFGSRTFTKMVGACDSGDKIPSRSNKSSNAHNVRRHWMNVYMVRAFASHTSMVLRFCLRTLPTNIACLRCSYQMCVCVCICGHFMPKFRPRIIFLYKIKVPQMEDWIGFDLWGHLRPNSRSPLYMLTVGPIIPIICVGCSFPMGLEI